MPAAAAREPSAAWDPTDTRPCSPAGRVLTRAPCCGNFPVPVTTCDRRIPFPCHRHVPGSLSPARTGRFPSCAYSQALRGCKACVAALQDRGCQVRSVTNASLGAGTSAAALVIHRTSGAPVCPRLCMAQYHAFLIGPRGLRNGTRYHRLAFAPALSAGFLTMATPPTIFLCVVLLLCILVTGR